MKYRGIKITSILLGITLTFSGCSAGKNDEYEKGMAYYESKDYKNAIVCLNNAIAKDNTRADYYTDLGMTYLEIQDYSQANDAFNHAVGMEKDMERAYRGLGLSDYLRGNYDDAVENFNLALNQVETKVGKLEMDILAYRADAQRKKGEYEEAYNTYQVLIKLGENVNQNKLNSGAALLKIDQDEEAGKLFDEILAQKNTNIDVYFQIYNAYEEADKKEKGLEYLAKALELKGDTSKDHLNRGKIYYMMGRYDTAMSELTFALNEDNSEAALFTGLCYEKKGDYETARDTFIRALQKEETPSLYNYLALCYVELGEVNKAWNIVHTLIENYPDYENRQALLWNEIILYEMMDMYPSAKMRILEYQDLYPEDKKAEKELQYINIQLQ